MASMGWKGLMSTVRITNVSHQYFGWLHDRMVLNVCPPPLDSQVRVSVIPHRVVRRRLGIWTGFSRGFSCILLPQISINVKRMICSIILRSLSIPIQTLEFYVLLSFCYVTFEIIENYKMH